MKVVIKEKNSVRINKFLDSVLYILGYTLVLLIVDAIFNSFDVDNFWYELLAVVIIYVLNKTVRPIIFKLTIPITALTFGLFYPFINLFILKLADWILGSHFDLTNIFIAFFVAILLSIMNFIMEEIIKKIVKRVKIHG